MIRYLQALFVFYAAWLAIVFVGDAWQTVLDGWPVALAMALGSFVAGSTPMGGGTVGFPVLVLGFDFPASLGRDFSFAIQSVGMVSAAAFILTRKQRLDWAMLRPALWGSALGTPLGLLLVAPLVTGVVVKVAFAVLWASFGVLHLTKLRSLVALSGQRAASRRLDRLTGFVIGAAGGALVSSITGVGVDMLLYVALVLVCKADMKVAIPTSVLLMAFTSVVGLGTQAALGRLSPQVGTYWLAAAPVVAVGAPLGSLVVERLGRVSILVFVSLLCLLQFAWTLSHEYLRLGQTGLWVSIAALLCSVAAFLSLARWGAVLADRRAQSDELSRCPAE